MRTRFVEVWSLMSVLCLAALGCGSSGHGSGSPDGGTAAAGGGVAGATGKGGAGGVLSTGGNGGMAGGSAGNSGTAGAGQAGSTGGGGMAGSDAGTANGVCAGDPSPNPDLSTSCNDAHAKAGAACKQDCCLGCGIDSLGAERCTCTAGKYASCDCPRPATWTAIGGECGDSRCQTEGGPCSPQGYASAAGAPAGATVLDGQDCVMNGNVCFTAETDGKHGCVCTSDPSGDFVMRCGLVEGWFTNNGMATTY